MATLSIPSQLIKPGTMVVPLTTVQRALWQLGAPILDAGAVAKYKTRAKRGMLWRSIRWQILAMAALVGLMCLGRQWGRVATVGADAVLLATLFGWLVNATDLKWLTLDYSGYQSVGTVPPHVSAAADALVSFGVPQEHIGVEYLKSDPTDHLVAILQFLVGLDVTSAVPRALKIPGSLCRRCFANAERRCYPVRHTS